jgi:D-sedoheptulose 7-phosphate isomerase
MATHEVIRSQILQSGRTIDALAAESDKVARLAEELAGRLAAGATIYTCGNGGSALESQHFAAELIAHFKRDRRSLPAMSLAADGGVLTAVANDFSFTEVFARQVDGLAQPLDVVMGYSTSGRSANVAAALRRATDIGALTVAFTGATGGTVADAAEIWIPVPSGETARIQEGHLVLTHAICEYIDAVLGGDDVPRA